MVGHKWNICSQGFLFWNQCNALSAEHFKNLATALLLWGLITTVKLGTPWLSLQKPYSIITIISTNYKRVWTCMHTTEFNDHTSHTFTFKPINYQRVWTHMYTKTESSVTTHQAALPLYLPIFGRYEQIPVTGAWTAQGPSLTLLWPAYQDTSQNQKQKLRHMQPCSLQCLVSVKAYSHTPMSSFCEGILTQTPVHVGCAQNVYAFMGVWA